MSKVKQVLIEKDCAIIETDNGLVKKIPLEIYLQNRYILGQDYDDKQLEIDSKKLDYYKVRNIIINKLSRKYYSRKELLDICLDNGLYDGYILIEDLEKSALFNEKDLFIQIIEKALSYKKGIKEIKKRIIDRKIDIDCLNNINDYIDKDKYNENIKYLVNKYNKIGSNKANKVLEKYVLDKVMSNGYLKEEVIPFLMIKENEENDVVLMEVKKYFKVKEVSKENIDKITKKLVSKGFNYVIIRDVIKEWVSSETN